MLEDLHQVMRKASASGLTAGLLLFFAALGASAAPLTASVSIEFLADGRCRVTAGGDGFRSQMTYTPKVSPGSSDLRCAMPPVPGGRRVDLTVVLPPGRRPSGAGAPTLEWTRKEERWQGAASLDAAPDVVMVEDWNSPPAVRRRVMTRAAIVGGGLLAVGALVVLARRRSPATGS